MPEATHLQRIRALMTAQELVAAAARQSASEKLANETKLRGALSDQEAQLEASLSDWSAYLASGRLEPHQLQRLDAVITRQDFKRAELARDVDDAKARTAASRVELAIADTQTQLTRDKLKDLKKSADRHRDEVAARAFEDRLAFDWSQA